MDAATAKEIRIKLAQNSMSMTDLASGLGISLAYLSDIMHDRRNGPKAQLITQEAFFLLDVMAKETSN
ncbi:helix-turn-helix domain-containing protein [Lacticaseibacillus saniviri]|nr:helix-turn-helix transcriptional regulator [Lacticaseibacillus saniviri]